MHILDEIGFVAAFDAISHIPDVDIHNLIANQGNAQHIGNGKRCFATVQSEANAVAIQLNLAQVSEECKSSVPP